MYSYVVKPNAEFDKDGIRLRRGTALTGEDARWLERPENAHLLLCVNRIEAHRIDDFSSVSDKAEG